MATAEELPSALERWGELDRQIGGERCRSAAVSRRRCRFADFATRADAALLVYLDYDGTLSPIVSDPDKAYMPERSHAAVRELSAVAPVSIVSGRARAKVSHFVQLPNLDIRFLRALRPRRAARRRS